MRIKYLIILCVFLVQALAIYNERPIIGILTEPFSGDPDNYTKNYIAASYIKFVEGAGGRVVPLQWDMPKTEME